MNRSHRVGLFVALFVMSDGPWVPGVRAQDPPAFKEPVEMLAAREERSATASTVKISPHESLVTPAKDREWESIDKVPPPPIAERPGEAAPSPNARWIEGYWDWDTTRRDFSWVTGTWRVPPPGRFWVNGYWQRQKKGWFRVPGFWSEPIAARTEEKAEGSPASPRDWHKEGPPPVRPAETIHNAPGPDYFYIAGEYVPDARGVVWRPGFWWRSQPGWEWAPARWVRQSTGWVFREGSWSRVAELPTSVAVQGSPVRSVAIVSPPASTGTPTADLSSSFLIPPGYPPPMAATNSPFAAAGSVNRPDPGPDGRTVLQPLKDDPLVRTGGPGSLDQGTAALIGLNVQNGENPSPLSAVQGNGNVDPAAPAAKENSPGALSQPGQTASAKPVNAAYRQPSPYYYGGYRRPAYYYNPAAAIGSRIYGAINRFLSF